MQERIVPRSLRVHGSIRVPTGTSEDLVAEGCVGVSRCRVVHRSRPVLQVYKNVCHGLFKKDKALLSFLFAAQTGRQAGAVSEGEWQFLLRSGLLARPQDEADTPLRWLEGKRWALVCALERHVQALSPTSASPLASTPTSHPIPRPHLPYPPRT